MPFANFRRQPVPQSAKPASYPKTFPAPTGGWVSAKNPAGSTPFKLYGPAAERLECFFPTETGIEVMGGSQKHATLSLTGEPVESVFSYASGTTRKMFGACNGAIYDITAPVSATAVPTASVTGQTSDYYSAVNYATAGGSYLYAFNGTDSPQLFDGTTWVAITGVSPIAITGVTTSTLSQGNVYRNRIFMVQGGTMNVWALPPDSLGGAAIQISLAGVFQNGGSVLFTATWSLDSGSGLDDKLVIMSTEGEVAVYQGSDPSDPADWSIVGVYDCPAPMGKNAFTKGGGDLLIVTERGLIPISDAVSKDKAAIGLFAVSRNIEPDWVRDARQRRAMPWEIVKWPTRQRAIISNPVTGDNSTTPPWCYVVNTTTGAWCKRTGWNTRCMTLHDDFVYFGSNDGCVYQMEITGADDGDIYYASAVLAWDHLGTPGFEKTVLAMRAQFIITSDIAPKLSVSTNYSVSLPTPPNAPAISTSPGVWDIGLWDVAQWDTGSNPLPDSTGWVSVGLTGYSVAPQIQLTSGSDATPGAELIVLDLIFEAGELMLNS